jgi:hypothetical protein
MHPRDPRRVGPEGAWAPPRRAFSGAFPGSDDADGQVPSAPDAAEALRGDYIFVMTASPNSLHFTSFAPSMRRAKS